MSLLINDLELAKRIRADREATDGAKHDEVWDGVYVMSPLPNIEHQLFVNRLERVFIAVVDEPAGDMVLPGVNVSERVEGWEKNYRAPDVAVILHDNPGRHCDTHWCGGPDFLVEILSKNDQARNKLAFYGAVGVRELLIVGRSPWELELYSLVDGLLNLIGRSTLKDPQNLVSRVLPIVFRIVEGSDRPLIEVTTIDRRQSWMI